MRMAVSTSVGHQWDIRLVVPGALYGPVILGPGFFVVQWGHFQGGW